MAWYKIKNLTDLNELERKEIFKINKARRNIRIIKSTRKNVKRGDGNIRINLTK